MWFLMSKGRFVILHPIPSCKLSNMSFPVQSQSGMGSDNPIYITSPKSSTSKQELAVAPPHPGKRVKQDSKHSGSENAKG